MEKFDIATAFAPLTDEGWMTWQVLFKRVCEICEAHRRELGPEAGVHYWIGCIRDRGWLYQDAFGLFQVRIKAAEPSWVNADIPRMAQALRAQAEKISDDEPNASARTACLYRAASHLDMAFAELCELPR